MQELLTGILTYCITSIGICMFSWLVRNWRLNGNGFLRHALRGSQKLEMPGEEDWAVPTERESSSSDQKLMLERIRMSPFRTAFVVRHWLFELTRG